MRELAEQRGFEVVEPAFVDDDRSAFSGKPRRRYLAMLEAIGQGQVDVVLAWHPDRLHRSPRELEDFVVLLERTGATVVTVQGGDYDLATASGRMTARVVGAVARHESEHKSERLRAKMDELRERGRFLTGGGARPFGWERMTKVVENGTVRQVQPVHESEARVVRELVSRRLAGEGPMSLVQDLNRRGVPTVRGKPWVLSTITNLLVNPRLAGLREVGGQLVPAPWPAIISEREHRELVALTDEATRRHTRSPHRYLLTGFVYCTCGARMSGNPMGRPGRKKPYYNCMPPKGCSRVFMAGHLVDELTEAAVFDRTDHLDLDAIDDRGPSDDPDAIAAVRAAEARVSEIEEGYASGEFALSEYRRLRSIAGKKLDQERSRLRPDTRRAGLAQVGSNLRARWPGMTLGQRRVVLEALGTRVTIAPTSVAIGPDRVDVTFEV